MPSSTTHDLGQVGLPWYDLPATSDHLDSFYEALRRLWPTPLAPVLDRRPLTQSWADPLLLLSQCCGPDLFQPSGAALEPFARPVFSNLDCEPGHYFSYIIAGPSSDGPLAVNARSSHSGATALLRWLDAPQDRPMLLTHGHEKSIEAVRTGQAAYAAIDAFSFSILQPSGVRIVGQSAPRAAPPFVSRADSATRDRLFSVMQKALRMCPMMPGLSAIVPSRREDYRSHCEEAQRLGLL